MTTSSAPRSTTLRLRGIGKTYTLGSETVRVLSDVHLELSAGDELAITGPSGSGKSTLLHLVGGLDTPTIGTIEVDGRSLSEFSPTELARYRNRSVGFVFQDHHLLPPCTVLENVLIPTLASGGASPALIERARSLIDRVGLSQRESHRPAQLSGGERQRVAIARALIHEPKLLLCDEPTGNLDRANAERVATLLLDLARDARAILLVVTHSADLANRLNQHVELTDGKLVTVARQVGAST